MVNNLEYYKVFYYVASYRSLTAAADALAISQPAVSQSVKQLETTLGTKLFTRASRGVRLTQEGELLFGYVAKGYEQIELGEQKLKQMLNLDLGEIHIGASDMTLQFYLLPFLERFHEKYPEIKVVFPLMDKGCDIFLSAPCLPHIADCLGCRSEADRVFDIFFPRIGNSVYESFIGNVFLFGHSHDRFYRRPGQTVSFQAFFRRQIIHCRSVAGDCILYPRYRQYFFRQRIKGPSAGDHHMYA